jgi:perosamine synthetase
VEKKRRIASTYAAAFSALGGITVMREAEWAYSSFWMYTVLVNECIPGFGSRDLMRELARQNIQTRPLWQPLHLSPAHRSTHERDCPIAEALNRLALSLPCSVGLTPDAQQRVVNTIVQTSRAAENARQNEPTATQKGYLRQALLWQTK